MKLRSEELIIESGIAGLSFALKAARHASVSLITKKQKDESNSNYAQGVFASVVSTAFRTPNC